jgi:hypothetical protein
MARNYKRNRYHPTPIERGSELEQDFLADAKAHRMERLPGPFIALRLADYYRAVREGRLLPEGSAPSFVAGSTHGSRVASMPNAETPVARPEPTVQPEPAVVATAPVVAETITASKGSGNFNFFFDDDEDEDGSEE